jgi:hypothetical protein
VPQRWRLAGSLACIHISPCLHPVELPHDIQENPVATSDVTALQRSDLNEFLFADVGLEANGMTLSVVSVFARQGSDPWSEAGRLAALPKLEATNSLAQTIAAMPRGLWDLTAAGVIADRLIGLLPARPVMGLRRPRSRWPAARNVVVLVCIALAVGFAFMGTMRRAPPFSFDGSDVASFTTPAVNQTGESH